jgi:hypothetical protein
MSMVALILPGYLAFREKLIVAYLVEIFHIYGLEDSLLYL